LYTCVPLLAAVCAAGVAAGLATRSGDRVRVSGMVALAAGLSLLPYAPALRAARQWSELVRATFSWGQCFSGFEQAAGADTWLWLALLAAGAAMFIRRVTRGAHEEGGEVASAGPPADERLIAWYAGVALLAGTAAFLLASRAAQLSMRPWYFLPWMALAAAALDALAGRPLRARRVRIAASVALALLTALHMATTGPSLRIRQTNFDLVAGAVRERAAPADLVVVYPWYLGVTYQRYGTPNVRWITNPPIEDHRIHRFDLIRRAMQTPEVTDSTLAAIAGTLRGGGTVWLAGGLPKRRPGPLPQHAPRAPDAALGWDAAAYSDLWGNLTAAALRAHAIEIQPVPVTTQAVVNPSEYELLFRVRGWR
ncbi:MAG: hypothetical protein ACRENS_02595, partial [Candidatus Eiseniibacteriota bacterium]